MIYSHNILYCSNTIMSSSPIIQLLFYLLSTSTIYKYHPYPLSIIYYVYTYIYIYMHTNPFIYIYIHRLISFIYILLSSIIHTLRMDRPTSHSVPWPADLLSRYQAARPLDESPSESLETWVDVATNVAHISSSSWGYPLIAGWFMSEEIPSRNG